MRGGYDLTIWKCLKKLDLTNMRISDLPELPATLRCLILNDNMHLRRGRRTEEKIISLPLLETFACARTSLDGSEIEVITRESVKSGSLKTLSIGDRIPYNVGIAEDEYPASETVEELSLASLVMQEQRMIQIVNLYPNVRRLDVSGTRLTGVAVKTFVQMGVEYLKLNECSEVGADAVEWARGQGVEVEFNFPSRSGNMRGFRDTAFAGAF